MVEITCKKEREYEPGRKRPREKRTGVEKNTVRKRPREKGLAGKILGWTTPSGEKNLS